MSVSAQAQTTEIFSEPAVVRFAVVVSNIGQTDSATLTVKEAGTTVATIPSLPSGDSKTLVFDLETSIAGQIQFEVSGKDDAGNEKAYQSNIIQLTYIEPTPEPTATPAPTAVPPTPTPEPTATPVPTFGEMIASHVNLTVLYIVAGVLVAGIAALIAVSAVSSAKRKKRMEQAIDTISLEPDVRDSFGKRRRRPARAKKAEKNSKQETEKTEKEEPIVPAPEFVPEEKESAPERADKNAEEGRRRRPTQEVTTDKTLRVAPIEDRPEFVPQGKVDDSQTRIFGKLTPESAKPEETPKNNAEQETIRLTGEDVQAIREQTRKDTFAGHGKKRGEIKPMKKKKGLFGLGKKDTDDDFFIDPDAQNDDDDDDLFE